MPRSDGGHSTGSRAVRVEAFIPEPDIERYHEPILRGFTRRNLAPPDLVPLIPFQDRVGSAFGAIAGYHCSDSAKPR